MSLADELRALTGWEPRKGSKTDQELHKEGVRRTAEWRRVAALPRRALDLSRVPDLTPLFLRGDSPCPGCELCDRGAPRLRLVQSAALLEAEAAGGLYGSIPVGYGKELISLLLPRAFPSARRVVLLTRSRLRGQLLDVDLPRYGRHFRLPDVDLRVLTYSELSRKQTGDRLRLFDPQLVVANEAHALRNVHSSAMAKRFRDWRRERPGVPLCALSGSFYRDSIRDYAHILRWCLGDAAAPVPSQWGELGDWGRALDEPSGRGEFPVDPGALLDLLGQEERDAAFEALPKNDKVRLAFGQQEEEINRRVARGIYSRRMSETRGVVMVELSDAEECGASLVLRARRPEVPPEVAAKLSELRQTWSIGGDDLMEAAEVAAKARQLACGFYYYWDWGPAGPDHEWLARRKAWAEVVRDCLAHRAGLYSPLMVWDAAERGELRSDQRDAWAEWREVRSRWNPHPPVATEWLSDFLVDDCLAWARAECSRSEPGIIWYQHRELGERLRARGLEVYGEGPEGDGILNSTADVVAASMNHREGKNLQRYCRYLVTTGPANAPAWQQLLGRSHRSGQRADEVVVDWHAHEESLESAVEIARAQARAAEEQGHGRQKLFQAQRIGF